MPRRFTEKDAFEVCKKCPYIIKKDNEFYCNAQCPSCDMFNKLSLRQLLMGLRVAVIHCPKGFW